MFLQIYDFFLKTGNVGPFILRRDRARAAPWHGHGMVFDAVSDAVPPLLTVPVQPRRKGICNILADRALYPAMQKVPFGLQKGMFQAAKGGLLQGERASFIKRPAAARTPHGLQGLGIKMCARVKNIKNLIVLQKFRLTLQLKNTS